MLVRIVGFVGRSAKVLPNVGKVLAIVVFLRDTSVPMA